MDSINSFATADRFCTSSLTTSSCRLAHNRLSSTATLTGTHTASFFRSVRWQTAATPANPSSSRRRSLNTRRRKKLRGCGHLSKTTFLSAVVKAEWEPVRANLFYSLFIWSIYCIYKFKTEQLKYTPNITHAIVKLVYIITNCVAFIHKGSLTLLFDSEILYLQLWFKAIMSVSW